MKTAQRWPVIITVVTLFILGLVGRSAAQSQMPTAAGPLELVDSNNRVIAPVCGVESGPLALLCLKANDVFIRLSAGATGFVAQEELFFSSTNCTPPAVVTARGPLYPAVNVAGSALFVEDTAAALQTVTVNSKRDLYGTCVLLSAPTPLDNMHATREFTGFDTFARPFRVREKASSSTPGGSTGGGSTGPEPDTTSPTVPANLTAAVAGSIQIRLTWLSSSDDAAVTGYRIERCTGGSCTNFTQVDASAGTATSYNDVGLTAGTSYRYRVRAMDGAGNLSGYSNTAGGTTPVPLANQSLVAAYSFDDGAGTSLTDLSGGSNTGTLVNGPAWSAGRNGSALSFDGRNQSVQVPDKPSLNFAGGSFTASAWVYPRSLNNAIFFGKYGTEGNGWRLETNASGRLRFIVNGSTSYSGSDKIALNRWQHVAVVQGAAGVKLYVDGVNVTEYGPSTGNYDNNAPLTIGTTQRPPAGDCCQRYFDGLVDDLRIYNRENTPDELQADMNNPLGAGNAGDDTIPPTAPVSVLTTVVSSTQINLIWTAATDNVAVTVYGIERCQATGCADYALISAPDGAITTYNDTALAPNTSYSYRLRASDGVNVSGYSSIASATTPPAPDVVAPSNPVNLTASVISANEIGLNWSSATDNVGIDAYHVERCAGTGCTNFELIGDAAVNSYGDSPLTENTSYSYRIKATDAAGNASGYSNTVVALTTLVPDSTAPSSPSSLTANAASPTQIELTWTASTDDRAVTSYRVERCTGSGCANFAQVGTTTAAAYTDSTVAGSVTYVYRVRAMDAASNPSGYSTTTSATTPVVPDTTAPSAPASLSATAASPVQIDLAWSPSTDNIGVTGYKLERCEGASCTAFAEIAAPAATSFSDTGLTVGTSYRYRVSAIDAALNRSGYSNTVAATTPASPDTDAPGIPLNLNATAASVSQVNLSWSSSTDNVSVTGYRIERCDKIGCTDFIQIGNALGTAYIDTGLSENTIYSYRVRALDAALNLSGYSGTASAVTPAIPDTTAPTAPQGVAAAGTGATQIDLSWTASTDNRGVTGYRVERCQGAGCNNFAEVGTVAGTSYSDPGRAAITSYSYRVRSADAAGNVGAYSDVASATTPDTQAPTAPAALTATTIGGTQINLSWTASTDNVGVTGYVILRCQGDTCSNLLQVAATIGTGTTYNNTGLSEGSSYKYRVRAIDASGRFSGDSNTVTAVLDVTKPSAPGVLTATVSSPTEVTLNWIAATDNRAVTGYQVERCEGQNCTGFAQIAAPSGTGVTFVDRTTARTVNTTFVYRVRAADAMANLSDYSNLTSVSMPGDPAPPTVPGNLHSETTLADSTPVPVPAYGVPYTVSFFWNSSTDNVGVTTYLLEQCTGIGCADFTTVIETTGTNHVDAAFIFTAGVSKTYRVRARDAAGNFSGSSILNFVNGAVAPPSPVVTLQVWSGERISLSWTKPASDVTMYFIGRCQGSTCSDYQQIAALTQRSYNDTGLASGATYHYLVVAKDDLDFSPGGFASGTTLDTVKPTVSNLTATVLSGSQIKLDWVSQDNVPATIQHHLERCSGIGCTDFFEIASLGNLHTYLDSGRKEGTTYTYRVWAMDAASNPSAFSNVVTLTAPDTTAPTAPAGLTATPGTAGKIVLSWTASNDNVALSEYLIERCEGSGCSSFAQIGSFPATVIKYTDLALTDGSRYSYRVRAKDASANTSAYSNTATGRADSTVPTKPGNFTLKASKISWTASTDNVGVAGYVVEVASRVNLAFGGTVCSNASELYHAVTTVSASTLSYSPVQDQQCYRVRAKDAAGNLSASTTVVGND